jgi:acyl dehydratase
VEAGHVALFQRAVGAGEPDFARLTRGSTVPALTFLQVADHFDPEFQRRPRHGQPWFGSGATSSGAEAASDEQQGLFHTDQLFNYTRHPRIGESLTTRRLEARRWTRQGRRGGALEFIERVTEFRDANGAEVVRSAWRDVRTERRHSEVTESQSQQPEEPVKPPMGATHMLLAENITRTQLVMYAGASGDFHPLHHDEPYVKDRGYPSVFVPGMLSMAMTGRALLEHTPIEAVREFGGRFHAQLWPGDSLHAWTTETKPVESGARRFEITAIDQNGRLILSAHALAEAQAAT